MTAREEKAGGTILIADDEDQMRKILRREFSRDYKVLSAKDGLRAINIVKRDLPTLVLLDFDMPRLNGYEVLKQLRKDAATRMIPVIFVTSENTDSVKVEILNAGADDYLTKPFSLNELAARVAGVLRRNRRALQSNPLTLLPGSPAIEVEVNRRIASLEPFACLYADIDHFKAFNDVYGYSKGDQVIRAAGESLRAASAEYGLPDDFLGHIGGDDFILVTRPSVVRNIAASVAAHCDESFPNFYLPAHRSSGFVVTRSREGSVSKIPLITMTLAAATTENRPIEHYAEVVETLGDIKRYLKGRDFDGTSAFLIDRRKD